MKPKLILFFTAIILLAGCARQESAILENPTAPSVTASQRPTSTRLQTSTPNLTRSVTPTFTLEPTSTIAPTPTWAVAGPGDVTAPILLYHHIDPVIDSPLYNVPPEQFAQQMQALYEWGYTTITISQLAAAITEGAPLPPRPIVITFDDGHMSVYNYAFPIMQQYGFVGVNYIVANRLEAEGFMTRTELDVLYEAGWEVGSHSYTHSDLTVDHTVAFNEMRYSMIDLAAALEQPVNTFAYPFGSVDNYLYQRAENWGYLAAVGLGKQYVHNQYSLFYLARIEIVQAYSLEAMAMLLPWSGSPE